MARKLKRGRHVRKPRRVKRKVARRSTVRRVKHSRGKLASVAIQIGSRKARGIVRSNPGKEFLVECYAGLRRGFFYFVSRTEKLTSNRGHATRFKNQYLARQAANYIRDHAPREVEWCRVCPA